MSSAEKIATALGSMAGILISYLISVVVSGLVVYLCWNYFPFLESIRCFSWWDGIILVLLVRYLVPTHTKDNGSPKKA